MSNACCKEFRGWCKSFTKIESFLTIVQFILLITFISLVIFVILHLMACDPREENEVVYPTTTTCVTVTTTKPTTTYSTPFTIPPSGSATKTTTSEPLKLIGSKCTWRPGEKTPSLTPYSLTKSAFIVKSQKENQETPSAYEMNADGIILDKETEGKEADPVTKDYVLALVKYRSDGNMTFGCVLTVVSDSWALTAASCVEAIEEVDSLDAFVMQPGWGAAGAGRARGVRDVRVHPLYRGANRAYDACALRADSALGRAAPRASDVDYLQSAPGERLELLGFGPYRGGAGGGARGLRSVGGRALGARECGGWAARHLTDTGQTRPARCGARALCVGPSDPEVGACGYCAGAPLLLRRRLLAIMADNPQCAVTCEPTLYVTLPSIEDWLDSFIYSD